jgi:hypothetical protein
MVRRLYAACHSSKSIGFISGIQLQTTFNANVRCIFHNALSSLAGKDLKLSLYAAHLQRSVCAA